MLLRRQLNLKIKSWKCANFPCDSIKYYLKSKIMTVRTESRIKLFFLFRFQAY